jgi:cysteine desulfurase/selenocysteine lyase
MNLSKLRQDFPLLQRKIRGRSLIYFDNACQSLRPQATIEAINQYYRELSACSGRSSHRLGEEVTAKVAEARRCLARFIRARRAEEIIFTRNTTEGINLIARSLRWQEGDVVVLTDKEHNSNLIPWHLLARNRGIKLEVVPSLEDNTFNLEKFREVLEYHQGRVRLVATNYTSNLDGVTAPVREIVSQAHACNALVLLDAAQAAPHHPLNVRRLDVDFLAFSGHKMLGPSGTGVLYGKYSLLEQLEPFLVGGDTVVSSTLRDYTLLPPPERFEAGLQNYAGIIGLAAAVRYLSRVGWRNIQQQEQKLNQLATATLRQLPRLHIIGPADAALRGSIVSFYVEGVDSHQIALMLDEAANIMVRSGQHCVHAWFAQKKIAGAVRISFYFYNTEEEVEIFSAAMKKILRVL